jgi:3-hydroxyacyl-CoA dehydrogenase/enoyl-CoA hydratase/3-hydroxybutyryl-CoA epimerase/3-hydroxyacyl-CoA dehydrogenase/enoyl-CoA hydratase/3-hydroxybutyryl-CoA epimerase/enoyl-CoA isomerase
MSNFTLSYPEPDIAVLTFDTPDKSANVLSKSVLHELSDHLDALEKSSKKKRDLAGLVIISGKPGQFVAGADLREFVASLDTITAEQTAETCRSGQNLFRRFSQCPFVTVAAIDGICVGGGAEIAVWCDRRIMTDNPKTQFGFPEVKLGIFPGWGGTARTPRIVGLSNAVELITGGESIGAAEASAMGLTSDVVPAERLLAAAIALVRQEAKSKQYEKDRERWQGPIDISPTELGFLGATASAYIQGQTKGHYPAPLAALEVLLGGAGVDSDTACQMEAEGMAQLFGSPINASLLNVFFLTDRNKKDRGVPDEQLEPAKITSAAVIGSGIMGAGITAATVKRNIPVCLTDVSREVLDRGMQDVLTDVAYNKAIKKADIDLAIKFAPLINATTSQDEVAKCDLIIEAVIENADIKKKIYANLESKMRDDAILASNTSTIPITSLAAELKHPERFCGIHFFNPVRRMKLVEVIRGEKTSDQTMLTSVTYAKQIGKFPIVVNDGPGFLVNRLLLPYMNEAVLLIAEGTEIADVERASKKFGMPMGPITLYDVVGLDTAVYAGGVLCEAFPDRFSPHAIVPALVEAGRLGQKSGRGFFSYENKKNRAQPDPELANYLKPHVKPSGATLDNKTVTDRLFLPMLVEATRVLEENIVRDPRDVDLGLIFGIGFPPFKGGLLFWADTLGAKQVVEMLKPYESLGPRYQPTDLLTELAAKGRKFYDISETKNE